MSENPQEPQTPQQPGPAPQQPGPAPQQPQDAPAYGTPQPQSPYQGPPPAGPAYSGGPYQPQPLTPSDERMWTVFAQVGAIIFSFVPPLVIWLVFKDRSRFVEQEAKESLNFTITVIIANVALAIIAAVTFGLGTILYIVLIAAVVFQILAAVENGKGAPYRYPVNIRFIK
ncbi:DUF4870 domain-containing protein [Promicromonospora sp. NPDC060204]|uniref:DUF4870 domain-containing protein n=1 Tax=Promicromonospora sp. NPDC060204 TaxID=3347071 RepID=UPI0036546C8E